MCIFLFKATVEVAVTSSFCNKQIALALRQTFTVTAVMASAASVQKQSIFLEYREGVYSHASSSAVVKLLPCLAVTRAMVQDGALATLRISDAFLQVPQHMPRKISLDGVSTSFCFAAGT